MANPGIGNKFVSVNLNKSYGQRLAHPPPPTSSYYAGRSRVGGGLVLLSKPGNVQKAGPKLSVPSPLNLPSLRKEHEHFDFSGTTHSGRGSSSGLRSTSAALGWTKPSTVVDKESTAADSSIGSPDLDAPIGTTYKSGAYIPPSFHDTVASNTLHGSRNSYTPSSGRNLVFRGEDFPSLRSKMASEPLALQKQKADPHQKPKQSSNSENTEERKSSFLGVSSGDLNSGPSGNRYGVKESSGETPPLVTPNLLSKTQKVDEYVKGVLPIVHMNQRSDWADDERDTGHGTRDWSRVQAPQKGERHWQTGGISKYSVPNSRGHHDDENLKHFPAEMTKFDSNGQENRKMNRDGNEGSSWRASRFHKQGYGSQDTVNGMIKDGQFANSFVESGNDNSRKWNTPYGKKDTVYGQSGRQWGHMSESHGSWATDKSTRRGAFSNDSFLSFGKPKHPFQKRDEPHILDNGGGFDDHDIFSNGIGVVGLVKKKKEALRTDFYDPVRESFEAELEHVQILQEQERRRIIEEHELAIEIARREEEDRIRLAKEHEENQRRLEAEAREAVLRAEQERLEALQRAEEQRLAREEEKQKILVEEERRKQAAKQKLLELEARIAKRQSEEAKMNSTQQNVLSTSNVGGIATEKGSDWDEGDRMVERATTSASSDTSNMSLFVDTVSRPTPYVEPPLSFPDRGKSVNIWRSDTVISGSKDHSVDDNIFSRKEHYNGRAISARTYREDGFSYNVDGFSHVKQQQRWNISGGDADSFIKDMENDSEFHRDTADKFGESVWGRQNQGFGNSHASHSSHSGRVYPNSDADVLHSIGRSRYSIRQPRVFPPPSSLQMHRSPQAAENDFPGPSASLGGQVRGRSSSENSNYKSDPRECIAEDAVIGHHLKSEIDDYTINKNVFDRCDSQSSLSVSSAPNSPAHLSHDDMEDSTSSMLTVTAEEKDVILQKNTSMDDEIGKNLDVGFSDQWDGKNERMQEQEEYEDDESCYEEEDEVHEVENTGIEDSHLQVKNPEEDLGRVLDFRKSCEVGTDEEWVPCNVNTRIPESHTGVLDLLPIKDSFQGVPQKMEKAGSGDLDLGRTDEPRSLPSPSQDSLQFLDVPGTISLPRPMISISMDSSQGESGSSMTESEFPAIQIGSIRMPLHLNHQESRSFTHLHPSQPPQFQFGQLGCTVPFTQGVIPSNYKPVSYPKPMATSKQSVTPQNKVPLPRDHFTSSAMARETVKSESRAIIDGEVSPSPTKALNNHPSTGTSSGPAMKQENLRTISRERRFFHNRNANAWPPMFPQRASCYDSGGYRRRPRRTFPRTEFRVRENIDRSQMMNVDLDHEKSHTSGRVIRVSASNGQRKGPVVNKFTRSTCRPEWLGYGPRRSPYFDPVGNYDKKTTRESTRKKNIYDTLNGIAEDGDALLQTGVACVYEQPGLVHSDGDDFIEVRSKKHALNDRRKQKAKEIKARSRVTKVPPKAQRTSPSGVFSINACKIPPVDVELRKKNVFSGLVINEDHVLINAEKSSGFNTFPVSQALAPIGTHPLNTENKDVRSLEARRSSPQVNSFDGNMPEILPLTQSQFDEAMKPANYEEHVVSLGVHTSPFSEMNMITSSSTVMKEIPFGSASTPLDPSLASEKIQFGAVTPPQIIPSNSPVISHGIGSSRLEIPLHTRISLTQECPLLQNSCVCLDECGVDAEAAASAVAAAAISCDEIVPCDLGSHSSLLDGRNYGVVGISRKSSAEDTGGGQQLSEKCLPQVSMSVSLPADLSVETTPISLWPPPLASPHNSSGHVISHFPGGAPSHFQMFDMNPMGATPVFSFGPHGDLSRCQSQPQNNVSCSGPIGQWQQQHHNGVDSVYGSSTNFSGSFINPHGGIPNGHGPQHMVVYNHFSPVGQFGQMGLSFMGTAYIPSGKQPDWQHNPTSSALGSSGSSDNGGLGSVNVFPAQHNSSNAPPMQHLAPGSPLLPMDTPIPMFDGSPFQGAVEMGGGWPHHHHQLNTSLSSSSSSHMQQPPPASVSAHLHHHQHPPLSLPPSLIPPAVSPFTTRPSPPSPVSAPPPIIDSAMNRFPDKLLLVPPPKDSSGRSPGGSGDGKGPNARQQQQQQQYGCNSYSRGHKEGGEWLQSVRMTSSGFQARSTPKIVRQIYVAKHV